MNDRNNGATAGSGIGFFGLLTLIFIVLKLTGVISWSWILVLAPIWMSFLISIVIIIVALLVLWRIDKKKL